MRVYCGCQMLSVIWRFGNMHQLKRHNGCLGRGRACERRPFRFDRLCQWNRMYRRRRLARQTSFGSELRSAFRCESVLPERSPPPPAAEPAAPLMRICAWLSTIHASQRSRWRREDERSELQQRGEHGARSAPSVSMPGLGALAARQSLSRSLPCADASASSLPSYGHPPASRLSNFNMYRDDDDDLTPDAEAPTYPLKRAPTMAAG